uniref:Probable serine/threonine-protein kinase DDB_G0282963 n=1 Tax=Dermatophagoides pteronyssinus TaxID=6956 RepID=A0A6P6Y5H0_DERPT|nr:probable serine/threonine-protein kinase DDB_G0282963 [Dermatophagoides pteronyssinus]
MIFNVNSQNQNDDDHHHDNHKHRRHPQHNPLLSIIESKSTSDSIRHNLFSPSPSLSSSDYYNGPVSTKIFHHKSSSSSNQIDDDNNDKKQSVREPRRISKLGEDFPSPSPPLTMTDGDLPAAGRINSKDLSRSNNKNSGSSSSHGMDDLLGGLAQLLGGNLKMPNSANSANGPPPLPPHLFSNPDQQAKLAQMLLGQMSNNGGLNQRIPAHLAHLIPRGGPNFPTGFSGGNPIGLPPQPPNFAGRPSSNFGQSNYPTFQLPFIPLLSSGGNSRPQQQSPPAIPLNNPPMSLPMPSMKPGSNINHNNNPMMMMMPPSLHGLSKAEMDALIHQFISPSANININNKTMMNNVIANLMSKISSSSPTGDRLDHSSNNKIDTFLPFFGQQNDTSNGNNNNNRLSITSISSEPPPQIITMQEDDGPSVFEMVVKHKIGPTTTSVSSNMITTTTNSVDSIRPTSTINPTISTVLNPDVTEIRNHHHHHHNHHQHQQQQQHQNPGNHYSQILRVTSNPNQSSNKMNDVVYGKRIPITTSVIGLEPSFTSSTTMITPSSSIISSLSTMKTISTNQELLDPTNTFSTPPLHSQTTSISYGKPVIMQLPIENVKPKIGQFDPTHTIDASMTTTRNNKIGVIESIKPSKLSPGNQIPGTGSFSNTNSNNNIGSNSTAKKTQAKQYVRRPAFRPRPNVPIVRIDTCIVGDDSTCDISLNEKCITELGLSSCQCRPGFARIIPRTNCSPVISLSISFRADKMAGNKLQFTRPLLNANSEEYQYLEFESIHALNSLFAQTKSLNTDLMAVKINRFYAVGGRTIVNATISLRSNDSLINSSSQRIKRQLQQELTQAIIDSQNNLGESQLSVDSGSNAITRIDDLDECSVPDLNDCSKNAYCINEFGGFRCECESGYEDKFPDGDKLQTGRICSTCSPSYCSNRGECLIIKGERVCRCRANFIGSQCDIDAEVLGVAVGGSIAALVIIVITFICLYMWNQRFRHEQQKIEAMSAASGHTFSYMNKPSAASLAALATMSRMSTMDGTIGGGGAAAAGYGRSLSSSSLWPQIHHHHAYSADSQQHLLQSSSSATNTTNSASTNGYGYTGGATTATTNNMDSSNVQHPNASHVYAQPVRVVTNTLSDHYDPSLSNIGGGGYSTDSIWNNCRNGRNSTRTIGTTNNNNNNKTSSSSKSRHHHDSYHNNDRRHNNNGTISGGQSSSTGIHYPSYKHDVYNETEFSTRELIYSPGHLFTMNPSSRHHQSSSHAYY